VSRQLALGGDAPLDRSPVHSHKLRRSAVSEQSGLERVLGRSEGWQDTRHLADACPQRRGNFSNLRQRYVQRAQHANEPGDGKLTFGVPAIAIVGIDADGLEHADLLVQPQCAHR
jgi:hypothetical protein